MYMEHLFYLKTLQEAERTEQILLISAILGGLLLIGIAIEVFKKKYSRQYETIKRFLNKSNKKETKKNA